MFAIQHQFGEGSTFYYVQANEDNWIEIYDPRKATVFKTKKEAKVWIKDNSTFEDSCQIVPVESAVESFEKWLREGMPRRTFNYPDRTLNTPYDPKKHNKLDVLKWWISIAPSPDDIQYKVYASYPNLYEIFEFIFDREVYRDRDSKKLQLTFKMRVPSDSEFSDFNREFSLIKDHVDYRDENNNKVISIIDENCGENGDVAHFVIYDDDRYAIEISYGRTFKGTLEKVFNFWRSTRPY